MVRPQLAAAELYGAAGWRHHDRGGKSRGEEVAAAAAGKG